jgi:hypothetical protein
MTISIITLLDHSCFSFKKWIQIGVLLEQKAVSNIVWINPLVDNNSQIENKSLS